MIHDALVSSIETGALLIDTTATPLYINYHKRV